ncbi:hypothetical protein LX36DRAFT_666665 [Colletotrichum falcatum]|nr:hypothetical protein LX36DRAFT_666665 [Colletotrichum falcatum]
MTMTEKDYTVVWVCVLHVELAASRAMLDRQYRDLLKITDDPNEHVLGNIGKHNSVMARLPSRQYCDVVVDTTVMQYDLVKILSGERVQRTATARVATHDLLNAVSKLCALHELTPSEVSSPLQETLRHHPRMAQEYAYTRPCEDRLFNATHDYGTLTDCRHRDPSKVQARSLRESSHPSICYGGVASGNQFVYFSLLPGHQDDGLPVPCNSEQFTDDVMERFVVSSPKSGDFLVKARGLQELWPTLGEEFSGSPRSISAVFRKPRSTCQLKYLSRNFSKAQLGQKAKTPRNGI